jgi:purine nucleoside permease
VNTPKWLGSILACLSVCIGLPLISQAHMALNPFPVKVLVFTMFASETRPWLQKEQLPLDFKVPGAYSDMHCSYDGLCVTTTGIAKANAATSATAILRDPRFSFGHSYFLTSGIAGTSPSSGTLGFAAWARYIVDWDQGYQLPPEDAPDIPYGYIPNTSSGTTLFHLNEKLTHLALTVTSHLKLQDSPEAIANRQKYPGQQKQHPYVTMCDTVTSDTYWSGKQYSDKAQYITNLLTKGLGKYCTTEQEDTAIATVLQRMGYLDHYLNLRTASDFDQPYQGQAIKNLFIAFPGGDIALSNAYLVGSTLAHYLLKHPDL